MYTVYIHTGAALSHAISEWKAPSVGERILRLRHTCLMHGLYNRYKE